MDRAVITVGGESTPESDAATDEMVRLIGRIVDSLRRRNVNDALIVSGLVTNYVQLALAIGRGDDMIEMCRQICERAPGWIREHHEASAAGRA